LNRLNVDPPLIIRPQAITKLGTGAAGISAKLNIVMGFVAVLASELGAPYLHADVHFYSAKLLSGRQNHGRINRARSA